MQIPPNELFSAHLPSKEASETAQEVEVSSPVEEPSPAASLETTTAAAESVPSSSDDGAATPAPISSTDESRSQEDDASPVPARVPSSPGFNWQLPSEGLNGQLSAAAAVVAVVASVSFLALLRGRRSA